MVSFVLGQLRVAHGNLSCRKGRMLPHTGLFLLGKVALQMRIRHRLKPDVGFRRPFIIKRKHGLIAAEDEFSMKRNTHKKAGFLNSAFEIRQYLDRF